MTPTSIAIGILALAAAGAVVLLLANANAKRSRAEDVPPAMRPGYSDAELETKVLERYMGWGVVLTLFFAVFLPVYFFNESNRINDRAQARFAEDFSRGEALYQTNCSLCHGTDLSGGFAASPYGGQWPAPSLNNIVARYEDSIIVNDVRQHIMATLRRGRPGTPMAAWSAEYDGPMIDQQLENITDFILANQVAEVAEADPAAAVSGEQLYTENCMRCHGEQLQGQVGPTLIGLFERHSDDTVMGILRNGIIVANGPLMPPWQNGYQHQPYTDAALRRIVSYLREQQPDELPPGVEGYQTPGVDITAEDDEGAPAAADTTDV